MSHTHLTSSWRQQIYQIKVCHRFSDTQKTTARGETEVMGFQLDPGEHDPDVTVPSPSSSHQPLIPALPTPGPLLPKDRFHDRGGVSAAFPLLWSALFPPAECSCASAAQEVTLPLALL